MRILYIDIDSQRPDHLSCYGYHRQTSPTIDSLAAEGVRFNRCYTPDAPCLPSRTALYSGRFGIQTGVVGHGATASEPKRQGPEHRGFQDLFNTQGLAEKLQKAGFHTAMISPFGQRHSAHWFYAGFNEIHNTGLNGMESAEQVMPILKQWMGNKAADDNWFLHLNFWDPHTPYRVPKEYGNPFSEEPIPKWLDDDDLIQRHLKKVGPHSAQDLGMFCDGNPEKWPREIRRIDSREAMRYWIDGYDVAIRYVDDQVAWVVNELKRLGIYENTAIILSADHGENQGELGIYAEHGTADEATCHIPMIIKWPGGRSGVVDDGLHYNIDLVPTLMDLLDQPKSEIWDGQSFAGVVKTGSGEDEGREDLVISQCAHVLQRSVRWDDWLYMRTYHCGFHLFPQEMLFNIAKDPHEQNDLASSRPDLCREGAWRLERWHDAQMQKMARWSTDVVDPLWTVLHEGGPFHASHGGRDKLWSPLKGYLQRLRDTNRADGAKLLEEKYAEFLEEEISEHTK